MPLYPLRSTCELHRRGSVIANVITPRHQTNLPMLTEMQQNPYLSPAADSTGDRSSRWIHWVLYSIATILFLLSLPVGWGTLILANQEYLHIWPTSDTYYGFEINGTSVSNEEAIRYGAATILIQWSLAILMIAVSRFMSNRRSCNKPDPAIDAPNSDA